MELAKQLDRDGIERVFGIWKKLREAVEVALEVLEGFGFDLASDSFAVEPGFGVAFPTDRFADGLNPRYAKDGVEALEDIFAGQSGKSAVGGGGTGEASVLVGDRLSFSLVLPFGRLSLPNPLLFCGGPNPKPRPPIWAVWMGVNPGFECVFHGEN